MSKLAHVLKIADTLADVLNRDAAQFLLPYTAQSQLVPRHELTELAEICLDVVPLGDEQSAASRLKIEYRHIYRAGIVVQKHLGAEEKCTARDLITFGEELSDYVRKVQLNLTPDTQFVESTFPQLYDPDRIESGKVFYTVLQTTWRAWR